MLRIANLDPIDSRALLRAALEVSDTHLIAHPGQTLTDRQRDRYLAWVERRRAGEPIAYLTGEREFHTGVDIVANAGTPVLATADGVVVEAGRLSSYGKAVFLAHGNGLASRYGHLSEVLVRPGQRVHRGDRIGSVGATGRATGFHLHYEVLRNDRKVDPIPYILDHDPAY